MKLILASGSPRRLDLLQKAGVTPEVIVYDVDETIETPLTPEETVLELATRKAKEASKHISSDKYILCADTVVACRDEILGKPVDEADAYRMLGMLSGSTHYVLTGHCIAHDGRFETAVDKTEIHFRTLTEQDIKDYVDSGEPFGKAGAYAIQEKGDRFVTHIDGAWDNVVGLSIGTVSQILQRYNKTLTDFI